MSRLQGLEASQGDAQAFGLVVKTGANPRYGIRYKDLAATEAMAKKLGLADAMAAGRFKLTGVPQCLGAPGLFLLLEDKGWELSEVLYVGDGKADFTATKAGPSEFVLQIGLAQQAIRIEAVGSKATQLVTAKKSSSSGAGDAMQTDLATEARGAQQRRLKEALRKWQAALSPEPTKRNHDGAPTGQTPPTAKAKATA